jgi:hypothetical protein
LNEPSYDFRLPATPIRRSRSAAGEFSGGYFSLPLVGALLSILTMSGACDCCSVAAPEILEPTITPAAVIYQLRAAAKGLLGRARPNAADGLTCKDLFPSTYRIPEPEHRDLFVSEVDAEPGLGFFYLILYDPVTGTVTQYPPRIEAEWTGNFGARMSL